MNTAFRYKAAGTYVFADDMVRMIKSLAKSYECKNIVVQCIYYHGDENFYTEIEHPFYWRKIYTERWFPTCIIESSDIKN